MNKKKFLLVIISLLFLETATAQSSLLKSGPMVGYSTMKEALLWVQTTKACAVKFQYWDKKNVDRKYFTEEITTNKHLVFVAKLIADSLKPGINYEYQLFLNGKVVERPYALSFQSQPLWQYRTDPPAFKFVMGSGTYINEEKYDRPGKPYGTGYEIFESMHKENPDFMLWLGDNVYLREADWNSRTGIMHRYTHTRSLKEMQPLLGSTHHYAIWDDHDYGPNDSDRSYWGKNMTEEAFNLFWGNNNTNLTGQGGTTNTFFWNDVQFFMLDNRYFRTPNNRKDGERTMLGEAQFQWLIDALIFSRASFKFIVIGGQVLNSDVSFEKYSTYGEEKTRLLKAIRAAKVPGVVFISGDVHHTELSKDATSGYPFYDFTVSPFTSGVYAIKDNPNKYYVEGTLVNEKNYGIIEVSGPRQDRKLKFIVKGSSGKKLWEREICAKDLKEVE